jgi:hypothetical protein
VPAGATTGTVVVTVGGLASNGLLFTVPVAPALTTLTPASGPVGTAVTIAGNNFGTAQGTSTVTFNGTAAAPTTWSATSLLVPVPAGATTGAVVVTVGGLASNGLTFTVTVPPTLTTLTPASGPVGTAVTIAGTNFGTMQGTSVVTFTGTAATPTSWSATSLTVPVPSGATTGNVVVTVGGLASNGVSFTVTGGGLSITPRTAVLTLSQTQPFTAGGSGSGSVVWSVDAVLDGSPASGTITPSGLYSAPNNPGTHTVTVTTSDQSQSASATVYVTNYPGTLTHHNDNFRTGQNLNETVLTLANVTSATFGKRFVYALDGNAYASPLYVPYVNIPGKGIHNVVYAATEHDSVYALDADGLSGVPLWQVSFINPAAGVTTVPASDTGECCDIAPEIGITGTPVIDPGSGTLYLVATTKEVVGSITSYVQKVHALDITTGAEKFGGPVVIQGTVPGTGDGSSAGQLSFDSLSENQRAGLLLNNGVVYVAFGSHGDNYPYHGWVMGYEAATLQQVLIYNTTPNAYGGGVWQSGGGLSADATGNIYFTTGNGTFDVNQGGVDLGDSVEKLGPGGTVIDYFTPFDQASLDVGDIDLGSAGPVLLLDQPDGPFPHLLIFAGKNGTIYVVNRDNMGHYNLTNNGQIVQSLVNAFPNGGVNGGNFSSPVYFNGHVYFCASDDGLKAWQLSNGSLSTTPTSQTAATYMHPGGAFAISANGTANGILWVVQYNDGTGPGVLLAYDATNLGVELYGSDQAGSRDTLDFATKFSIPLVANGKVFVGAASSLTAYGLLP